MHRSAARDWEEPELLSDLPHNIELEQALLGILLISNASYPRVSPLVTPADFYEPLHGRLFEAIGSSDLQRKLRPGCAAGDACRLLGAAAWTPLRGDRRSGGITTTCRPGLPACW